MIGCVWALEDYSNGCLLLVAPDFVPLRKLALYSGQWISEVDDLEAEHP